MALTNAERNKKKRDRKKKQKEEASSSVVVVAEGDIGLVLQRDNGGVETNSFDKESDLIEIEYIHEPINLPPSFIQESSIETNHEIAQRSQDHDNSLASVLERFQSRASILVSDTESNNNNSRDDDDQVKNSLNDDVDNNSSDFDEDEDEENKISKRQLRLLTRPTIAQLKNIVSRPDLVEAHDICAPDPTFLLYLKATPGSVPVPRHWGRKRKYLQGKRGTERVPYSLPDFIVKTGIVELRGSTQEDEAKQSAKQKNRSRVAPKMGGLDVDYRVLHDAFFKHQNISHMKSRFTHIGDLYYEGKEFETHKHATSRMRRVGTELSDRLKEALGMTTNNCPPPWLVNMQRYGPPPSYPNLKIPGLNAPLPNSTCSYGYHVNGWGKPPVDAFGRPLYGGNPFDPPGGGEANTNDWDYDALSGAIVTSDGKTIKRKPWGVLPTASTLDQDEDDESEEEEEKTEEGEDMEESGDEVEEVEERDQKLQEGDIYMNGMDSGTVPTSTFALRKTLAGEEIPMPMERKNLYTILHQTAADKEKQNGVVFASDIAYVIPPPPLPAPPGAESVVSKVMSTKDDSNLNKKRGLDDDTALEMGKKFKF